MKYSADWKKLVTVATVWVHVQVGPAQFEKTKTKFFSFKLTEFWIKWAHYHCRDRRWVFWDFESSRNSDSDYPCSDKAGPACICVRNSVTFVENFSGQWGGFFLRRFQLCVGLTSPVPSATLSLLMISWLCLSHPVRLEEWDSENRGGA